jgi:bifunctional non-homologous end joining protein LigD
MAAESRRVGRRSVSLSKPDKVLFPDDGFTKKDLFDYYLGVADAMLPYVKDRLLTMERFPDGIAKHRFFQKDISDYFPTWVDRQTVPKKGGRVTHVVVREKATLAYLADQATITMHVSLSTTESLDHPDQLVFDLDPSVDDFAMVRHAALDLRALLEDELKLYTVVKTSGSRGLHVTTPVQRGANFGEVRKFGRDVASYMAEQEPDKLTVEGRKDKRGDRIFLDWMRNSRGATVVAPYTVRARPGAPVAMPLDWSEVADRRLDPQRYKMSDALRAVDSGDPWRGWRRHARSLEAPMKRLHRLR